MLSIWTRLKFYCHKTIKSQDKGRDSNYVLMKYWFITPILNKCSKSCVASEVTADHNHTEEHACSGEGRLLRVILLECSFKK